MKFSRVLFVGRAWVCKKSQARADRLVRCILFWEGKGL